MSDNMAKKLPELLARGINEKSQKNNCLRSAELKQDNETRACKQIFIPLPCLPFENNLVYCFILSVWDNIIGPQTVQVWKRKPNPNKNPGSETIPNINFHKTTFDSENTKKNKSNTVQLDQGISKAELSAIQVTPNSEKRNDIDSEVQLKQSSAHLSPQAKHGIGRSLLHSSEREGGSRLQSIVQFVSEHTVTLAQVQQQQQSAQQQLSPSLLVLPQHRIIVQAVRFVVREEGVWVPHCLSMVVPLQEEAQVLPLQHLTAGYLIRVVRFLHSLLDKGDLEGIGASGRGPLQELCGVLVSLRRFSLTRYPLMPAPPSDRQLLLLLLTSHLTTAGYTVVSGDTSTAVNKVLMWLALFVHASGLSISRLCVDPHHNILQPGLLLQGIVINNNSGKTAPCISAERLMQFGRPVTLCDLTNRTVKRTITSHPNREVLRDVVVVSCCVRSFCHDHELLVGHAEHVRRGHIAAFTRCLRYQALAVIQWLKHSKCDRRGKTDAALREVFAVNEATLDIILSHVEELQPGLLATIPP